MGAINYGTSYYFYDANNNRVQEKDITIGLKPTSYYSDEDSGFVEWLQERKSEDEDFEYDRYDYDAEQDQFRREDIENYLKNADMPDYFTISLESGYYEGFYLKIENEIPWLFNDYEEKRELQKDITAMKKILLTLINEYGLVVVYPGWCTGYADDKKSVSEIVEFIRNLREEIKNIDTYYTYKRRNI